MYICHILLIFSIKVIIMITNKWGIFSFENKTDWEAIRIKTKIIVYLFAIYILAETSN